MSGRGNRGGGRGRGIQDGGGRGRGNQDGGGRGRGNQDGGGRGRGNQDRGGGVYHPSAVTSHGRDGGGGGGRGRGRNTASSSGYVSPIPPSTETYVSLPSASSLSGDFQQKVTVESSSSAPALSPAPTVALAEPAMQQQPAAVKTEQPAPVPSKAMMPPMRPDLGTIGKKGVVRANHFLVEVSDSDLHHYDVTITPEVTSKRVCRDILSKLVEYYRESHMGMRRLAYDGKKSAFTQGALPFESKEFVVKLDEKDGGPRREREFKVTIRFAAKPDMEHLRLFLQGRQHDAPQETIQALDVALRATPSITHEVVGRAFFSPDFGEGPLGDGLGFWKGFYQSLRPTQMGLSLNVDTSARAFYEPIWVSDFVAQSLRKDISRPLSDQDRVKIKKVLKGVRVETRHTKYVRSQKITGLSTQPLNALTFTDATGAKITVVQYFRSKYNISLKFPLLPAIQVGTDARPTYLPMEVCRIKEGQRYTRKLNEKQVTAMLNATCQQPKFREAEIQNMVNSNNYNQDELANKEFGIQVRPTMVSIEARVLPPPSLKYHETGKESLVNPHVGQWNMINKKMVNGGRVDAWACVNFSRSRDDMVYHFCSELGSMCTSKGMAFNPRPVLPLRSYHPGQIEKALHEIHSQAQQQLNLLIVILPDQTGQYGTIKRVCETELGIVSQCCQPRHVPKCQKQYLENVAMKINVKVGGRNTVLLQAIERKIPYLTDRPTIIFGADVTHPQPGEDSSSSIAALVASMDWPEVTKYRGLFSAQPHRQEIIQDLYHTHTDPVKGVVHGGMFRDHLIEYFKLTGQKPHRIIFFRDGVSEGQFSQVLSGEMNQIRKACVSLEEKYMPRITFVVVQKRHHTRLFPNNHNDKSLTDKSGNILPGTVIDTKICHPTEFDFYLCSHAGIKGTSRPTHYHVLYDDNGFTADGLQMLTNSLCYTYARCTRSVSIVPPAYYAHLLAFRARHYSEGDASETDSSAGRRGGAATRDQPAAVRVLPRLMDNVKKVMFFC